MLAIAVHLEVWPQNCERLNVFSAIVIAIKYIKTSKVLGIL